ncbi:MAG TPA: hypothetical protein VHO03_15985 [Ignavibacteriales bacterium]|nr:hypothetical protein [Ignavibacteriales bacterium]
MKPRTCLLLLVFFSILFYSGCSKDDNSANPDNQNTFKGSDYQPLASVQNSKVTANVSVTYYDSLGTLTRTESGQGPMDTKKFIPAPEELNKLVPDEFKIGQEWFILGETSIKVKAAEEIGNYISSTSKSYENAVRLEVTSNTSEIKENVYSTIQSYFFNVYIVKGLGIVDVKVENYSQDHTSWDWDYSSGQTKKHFYRKVVNGTMGL